MTAATSTARVLGVLGGMGPLAGAAFTLRLVELTEAQEDQQHIPTVLWNDPRVPDRSAARLAGGPDPLPAMQHGVHMLALAGVACIAIPCNTAHLWFDKLRADTGVPLLHIVDAVIDDLRQQGIRQGRIGVLGTPATLSLGLYQGALQHAGYDVVLPPNDNVVRDCVAAIAAVKAGRAADAWNPADRAIRALAAEGACAIVLGCTELPLAVPPPRRNALGGMVIVDSIDALARAAITYCRPSA